MAPRANRSMASAGAAHRYSGARATGGSSGNGSSIMARRRVRLGTSDDRVLLDDLLQPDPDGRLDERDEHPGPILARRAMHHHGTIADVFGHGLDGQHQLPAATIGHVVVQAGDVVGLLDAGRVVGVDHPVDQEGCGG